MERLFGRYEIRATMPATLAAVEEFIVRTRAIWDRDTDSQDDFAIELLLREALTNAVTHGCGQDPAKRVRCVLRVRGNRVFFAVRDEGAGFDWQSAWGRQSISTKSSGRGMEILQKYASRVRFGCAGTQVAVARRLA